jgi:uncharacterized protein (TIGR02186 family)
VKNIRCRRLVSRLGAAVLAFVLYDAGAAHSDEIVADLSSHLIAITSGFTGTSVVLFGATDGPGDVVAVVRGPERDLTVWRKGKIAGIWANRESITFGNVPSFYAIAASRPPEEVVPPAIATRYRIGVDNLKFEAETEARSERVTLFTQALIRQQQRLDLFPIKAERISFLGERLFRATISFPENVPTGTYLVEVFMLRNRAIVGAQTTPLVVSKVGVDAAVFDFANTHAAAYGAIAVLMAVVAGWLASLPFRGV